MPPQLDIISTRPPELHVRPRRRPVAAAGAGARPPRPPAAPASAGLGDVRVPGGGHAPEQRPQGGGRRREDGHAELDVRPEEEVVVQRRGVHALGRLQLDDDDELDDGG